MRKTVLWGCVWVIATGLSYSAHGETKYSLRFSRPGCGHVRIDHHLDFDLTQDFTIATWIKPGWTSSQLGVIVSQRTNLNHGVPTIAIQDGHLVYNSLEVNYRPEENRWTHLAVTVQNGTNVSIYANGHLVHALSDTEPILPPTSAFIIGNDTVLGVAECHAFYGNIADVQIWNRALAPVEQLRIFAGQMISDGLVAAYPMTEGHGLTVSDRAGNHPGTISGAVNWSPGVPTPHVLMNYQGYLVDDGGDPLTDYHAVSMELLQNGTMIWSNRAPALLDVDSNGLFNVTFGNIELGHALRSGAADDLQLRLNVHGLGEQGEEFVEKVVPTQPLVSVPYAMKAIWADTAHHMTVTGGDLVVSGLMTVATAELSGSAIWNDTRIHAKTGEFGTTETPAIHGEPSTGITLTSDVHFDDVSWTGPLPLWGEPMNLSSAHFRPAQAHDSFWTPVRADGLYSLVLRLPEATPAQAIVLVGFGMEDTVDPKDVYAHPGSYPDLAVYKVDFSNEPPIESGLSFFAHTGEKMAFLYEHDGTLAHAKQFVAGAENKKYEVSAERSTFMSFGGAGE